MKPSGCVPLTMCVAAIAGAVPSVIVAADAPAFQQELASVADSNKVTTAFWTRREDSYTLQVVVPVPFSIVNTIACLRKLDPTFGAQAGKPFEPRRVVVAPMQQPAMQGKSAEEMRALGMVNVADELLKLVPRQLNMPPPNLVGDSSPDARLVTPKPPPKVIQVWLLRADGTQVLPMLSPAGANSERVCGAMRDPVEAAKHAGRYDDEITYRFPKSDSEQAVAAAFMIDDSFYIETLRPPTPVVAQ